MRVQVKSCLGALALVVAAGLGAGCSGVNANGSVSPASFFLPGLMDVAPPKPAPADADAPPPAEIASIQRPPA